MTIETQSSQRDQILQQQLFELIKAHTHSLEQENIQLRRSLLSKKKDEKELKRRVQVWERKVRAWFEQRKSRVSCPPPLFHRPHVDNDNDDNMNEKTAKSDKREIETHESDRIRFIVETASKTLLQKKRQRNHECVVKDDFNNINQKIKVNEEGKKIETKENETSVLLEESSFSKNDYSDGNTSTKNNGKASESQENNPRSINETKATSQLLVKRKMPFSLEDTDITGEEKIILNNPFPIKNNSNQIEEMKNSIKTNVPLKKNENIPETYNTAKIITHMDTNTHQPKNDSKSSKTSKNPYKYKEVVRKRADRRSLQHAHTCAECRAFFDAVCYHSDKNQRDENENVFCRKFMVQDCSRHRSRFTQDPPTPEGFWDLSFADSIRVHDTKEHGQQKNER